MTPFNEAYERIGRLSSPSKMPGFGWSTSAYECITGSKLREVEGSTCSFCYATRGRYRFSNVKEALERRMNCWKTNPNFVQDFITVLHDPKIVNKSNGVFRWFDSGDLQSVKMLEDIVEIAKGVPELKFWLPTRELGIVRAWYKSGNRPPENLFIKLSAPMIGEKLNNVPKELSFTSVGADDNEELFQCVAPTQGNQCLDCRACWSNKNVNYHKH